MRRYLALIVGLLTALSVMTPLGAAAASSSADGLVQVEAQPAPLPANLGHLKSAPDGIFLVRLTDAPVATYRGGVAGISATSPAVTGAAKLDASSPAAVAYRNHLEQQQNGVLNRAEAALGRALDPHARWYYGVNGFAVEMTAAEAMDLAQLPGVASVRPNFTRYVQTDAGPSWVGAPGIWDGSATGVATMGEGIIVGIIDTGINPSNPSFADIGGDGYDHPDPGVRFGVCDPLHPSFDPTFPCNDKLIGAFGYPSTFDDPVDDDGHGSHTASTTAGNFVAATVIGEDSDAAGGPIQIDPDISGVAPHAHIVAFDGCNATGGCPGDALVSSIDDAIAVGVDVINYSIGGGSSDPWNDDDSLGFLAAREAGIFVATSAGNSGPGDTTVGSPADAPWLTSVGASTHDRNYPNTIGSFSGGDTTPPPDLVGKGFTVGYGPAPIVYAGDFGDAQCLTPFPAGTWSGEIVVCDRGQIARVDKGANAKAGGAGGFVLANTDAEGEEEIGDAHFLPGVHLGVTEGDMLRAWLATGTGHMATISGATLDIADTNGDIMAAFSSRGPNAQMDIISPNVTAPGVDIIAANGTGDEVSWGFSSGTSMSSPHVAGAGALLSALYPTWTPAQIQSALMTTADTTVTNDDGSAADWFDMGSGRIQVAAAANAGLVLDETEADYLAADPAMGGDPKQINLPSFANSQCLTACTWTREVTNPLDGEYTWTASVDAPAGVTITVSPDVLTLAAGATASFDVTADVSGAAVGDWMFGSVTWTGTGGGAVHPPALMPLAVIPSTGVLPGDVVIHTRRDAGSVLVEGIESIEVTDLVTVPYGLVQGTQVVESLSEDPTNGDPYDNIGDGTVSFVTTSVPAGAARLIAETVESTAVDIDLYVGTGLTPSAATEVCSSTTPTAIERCDLSDPAEGDWWILVQNWSESTAPPDDVTLSYAVVAGDAGNMTVEGPASVPAGTPYDLTVFYDDPAISAGDRWYGAFSIGSSPGNEGDIGTLAVDLVRFDDDVSKTVSADNAVPGDTLTYTITIQPNVTDADQVYELTDVIPDGLTYVDGSATGGATVTDGVLEWSGTLAAPDPTGGSYTMTTSDIDAGCTTGFLDLNYINLEDFAIGIDPGIAGDTVGFTAFTDGADFSYYGTLFDGMGLTDDGFGIFDFANYGGSPWVQQVIPDPEVPNNLMAALWFDGEIFPDATLNHGVSLAITGDTATDLAIVEWDDLQPWGGGTPVMDFEIVMLRQPDDTPGVYEIAFAYDNVQAPPASTTVGVENLDGSAATVLLNDEDPSAVIHDGLTVCFDFVGQVLEPVVITYDVTVDGDANGVLTNLVTSITADPGSMEESTSVSVVVDGVDLTPQERLAALAETLSSYPDTGQANFDWAVDQAALKLTEAGSFFVDGDSLDPTTGGAAFQKMTHAIALIKRAAIVGGVDLQPWVDEIAHIAHEVAQVAVDDALAAGGNPDAIKDAMRLIQRSELQFDLGREIAGMTFLRRAWILAQEALGGE